MTRYAGPDIWPWARANMTPAERREVIEFGYRHKGVPVVVGYNRRHGFFSWVNGHRATGGVRAIDAFRAAAALAYPAEPVEIVSLLA